MTARDSFSEVGAALRASHRAARGAGLTAEAWRLLSVIHEQIGSYSRLGGHIGHRILADEAQVSRRSVRRILQTLADAGTIVYTAGVGGQRSLIGLPSPASADTEQAFRERAPKTRAEQTFGARALDARRTDVRSARPERAHVWPEARPGADHNEKVLREESFLTEPSGSATSSTTKPDEPRTDQILRDVIRPGENLPRQYVGHLARRIKQLLDEGQAGDVVRDAARLCVERGRDPSCLASLVVEVRKQRDDVTTRVVPLEESRYGGARGPDDDITTKVVPLEQSYYGRFQRSSERDA